jgi:hypothetical protein
MLMRRTSIEPVSPANKLQLILSWLSGGMHHHIRMLAGVNGSFFYRIIYEVIEDAINQADKLRIQFPATPGDRIKVAAGFGRLSKICNFLRREDELMTELMNHKRSTS